MKKRTFAGGLCVIAAVMLLGAECLAAPLSPSFPFLEKSLSLKKCGVAGTALAFSGEDFDGVLGGKTGYIRMDKLPDAQAGKLYIGNSVVCDNQLIAREDFDRLYFLPSGNEPCTAAFTVSDATAGRGTAAVSCTVNLLKEVNLAPVSASQDLETAKNVAVFRFLSVSDPENDAFSVKVVSYPAHGTLSLDKETGYFSYTPKKDFVGVDSFSYRAADVFGNSGGDTAVKITVRKPQSDTVFSDMTHHWAYNSALALCSAGLMQAEKQPDGTYTFSPDGPVTRGDFLAMALIRAGYEPKITAVAQSGFSDDEEIPANIRSYAEYARVNGIVSGYDNGDGTYRFDSFEPITRAQAAVMLDRILDLPDVSAARMAFADQSAIPVWAGQAFANLTACGIFNGTGFGTLLPQEELTRAQAAEILASLK